jgi:hypothetical protein
VTITTAFSPQTTPSAAQIAQNSGSSLPSGSYLSLTVDSSVPLGTYPVCVYATDGHALSGSTVYQVVQFNLKVGTSGMQPL